MKNQIRFVPFIERLGLPALVSQARLPGTKPIPTLSYFLLSLALKLAGDERLSHGNDHNFDQGLGLFAGLNVLPKCTAMSTYGYSLDAGILDRLQRGFAEPAHKLGPYGGTTFNLDFHAVPHWGDDEIVVRFPKRAHNPILRSLAWGKLPTQVTWLGNRRLRGSSGSSALPRKPGRPTWRGLRRTRHAQHDPAAASGVTKGEPCRPYGLRLPSPEERGLPRDRRTPYSGIPRRAGSRPASDLTNPVELRVRESRCLDSVFLTRGETGTFPNNGNDDRTVSVHIQSAGGNVQLVGALVAARGRPCGLGRG